MSIAKPSLSFFIRMSIVELGQLFFKAPDNCTALITVNIKTNWRFNEANHSQSVMRVW